MDRTRSNAEEIFKFSLYLIKKISPSFSNSAWVPGLKYPSLPEERSLWVPAMEKIIEEETIPRRAVASGGCDIIPDSCLQVRRSNDDDISVGLLVL